MWLKCPCLNWVMLDKHNQNHSTFLSQWQPWNNQHTTMDTKCCNKSYIIIRMRKERFFKIRGNMYMREQKPWVQTTVAAKTRHSDSLVDISYTMAYGPVNEYQNCTCGKLYMTWLVQSQTKMWTKYGANKTFLLWFFTQNLITKGSFLSHRPLWITRTQKRPKHIWTKKALCLMLLWGVQKCVEK